jgi:Cu(I)/Ag(I) efflux system membrane fusion protein
MKARSFFSTLLFAAIAVSFLSNCSGSKKDAESANHENHEAHNKNDDDLTTTEPQFQVDEKFQEQLSSVFTSYIDLKDAFVSSDANKVQQEASEVTEALAGVDMKLVSGSAHNDWMNYLAPMQTSLGEIASSNDLESQRKAFSTLSDNLYKSVKAFGLGGKEAFHTYCPMAFDNEGAYWLSDNQTVRNPYFGQQMLTCGEVKEKLR